MESEEEPTPAEELTEGAEESTGEEFATKESVAEEPIEEEIPTTIEYESKQTEQPATEVLTEEVTEATKVGDALDDRKAAATAYTFGKQEKGTLSTTNVEEWYKFTLPSSGKIILNTQQDNSQAYHIESTNGQVVWQTIRWKSDNSGFFSYSKAIDLTKGTYYFTADYMYDGMLTVQNYNFKMTFTPSNESFAESGSGTNNTRATASAISIDKTYKGQMAVNDMADYYKFTLAKAQPITVSVRVEDGCEAEYYIYDSSGKKEWSYDKSYEPNIDKTINLPKGTYYFLVKQRDYDIFLRQDFYATGNYSFILKTAVEATSIKLDKKSLTTYEGNSATLKASIAPSNATDKTVTWSSSNTSVATVDASGKVAAKKAGSATITAKTSSGKTATCKVTVKAKTWTRIWGQNALKTMQSITKTYGSAKTAVVATNADFKDSLAAAALAGSLGAPMLTTSKGSLSAETKSELNRMGVTTVYLIGTTNDVSANTEKQIKALSKVKTVKRISASSASAKAIACAKSISGKSDTVIIATQNNFKDALSVSSYAYASKSPILYAESNKKLSNETVNYIKGVKFKKAIIVGGPNALPISIGSQLKSAGIAAGNISRLAGSTQYHTSRVIAEWACGKLKNGTGGGTGLYKYASVKFQPNVKLSANKLGVARAEDTKIGWKDALAGAALCGKNKSVILLADVKNSEQAVAFVKAQKASIYTGYVFGGTAAVPKATMDKLVAASK